MGRRSIVVGSDIYSSIDEYIYSSSDEYIYSSSDEYMIYICTSLI